MHTAISTAAAATAAGTLLLTLAGPASAATGRYDDRRGEARTAMDLYHVRVAHHDRTVVVATRHDDVDPRPRAAGSVAVFFDVTREHRGPEYALVAGTTRGTDYALAEVDGWRIGDRVHRAKIGLRIDHEADQVRLSVTRRALGLPGEVRVAVRVEGARRNGTLETDWLRTVQHLTPWVAAG